MEFLDPQEAEKIDKQKWKQFWWPPFFRIFSKSKIKKKKTETVNILQNLSKFLGAMYQNVITFSKNMAYFLALIVDSSTSY